MKSRTLTCITAMTLFAALGLAGNARAQIFSSLNSFHGLEGNDPVGGLVQGTNGALYGTTIAGVNGESGGTVFAISPSGALTLLYGFCSQSGCTDGAQPQSALLLATDGNFYGTTGAGGAKEDGTVFKITPSGTLTTLYSFCSQSDCTDGVGPLGGLIQGTDGNFYGTTFFGGAGGYCIDDGGCGTVFRITPAGTLTTLHSFDGTDGEQPIAALVQATDGGFYGTTEAGGTKGGYGTVFRITANGTFKSLHSFGGTDGATSEAPLIQATDGNFYGTTEGGGARRSGTIFKITPSGTLTTFYSFCSQSGCADGGDPFAGLVQATDGSLYGTTVLAGANREGGTLFKITFNGALTTLYGFCSQKDCADGYRPYAPLVQDTSGTFYGTTAGGGAEGYGTAFSLSVGLGPFVETNPASGKVGEAVRILGTDLTGATSVTFNGTAATFKVSSASLITTTIPAGATTGPVEVVTPSGTLTSNVPFRVTQ